MAEFAKDPRCLPCELGQAHSREVHQAWLQSHTPQSFAPLVSNTALLQGQVGTQDMMGSRMRTFQMAEGLMKHRRQTVRAVGAEHRHALAIVQAIGTEREPEQRLYEQAEAQIARFNRDSEKRLEVLSSEADEAR